MNIVTEIPLGHSVLSKSCARTALIKIKDSTCLSLRVHLNDKEGFFVVCKGKIVRGEWKEFKDEEAWNVFLKEIEQMDSESYVSINFYPPPEDIDIIDEMSADALVAEDVGTEYVASIGVLALGKAVLGIIHRFNASGIEFDDIKVTVKEGIATLVIINPRPRPPEELVKNIASMYLHEVGIKEVVVELA